MWKRLWGIRHVRWFIRKLAFVDWLVENSGKLPDKDDPARRAEEARLVQEIDRVESEIDAIWEGRE